MKSTSTQAKTMTKIQLEKLVMRKKGLQEIISGTEIIVRLNNESLLSDDGFDEGLLESLVKEETRIFQDQVKMIDTIILKFERVQIKSE